MKKILALCLAAAAIAAMSAGCMSKKTDTASSAPTPSPTVTPSPSMSSSESMTDESPLNIIIKDEKIKAAYDAVQKEFGEFYVAMPAVITEAQMTEMYYIKPEDIEEFVGEMSMVNVSGDMFVAVKAKPGKIDTVKTALEKRRTDVIEQFRTYPVNYMDIKSEAAEVIVEGDYAFMVLMGEINVADGQEATLDMAKKEVERAKTAILSAFGK